MYDFTVLENILAFSDTFTTLISGNVKIVFISFLLKSVSFLPPQYYHSSPASFIYLSFLHNGSNTRL